jgi:hypothetical protein
VCNRINILPSRTYYALQVETFQAEFKLRAIALNSTRRETLAQTFKEIVSGKYQIVILSPEMMLTRRFLKEVLQNAGFSKRVISVVIDEAHVVSHWGKSFRKKYAEISLVRAFLPKGTPFAALSATLPARIRADVASKLRMKDYVWLHVGNDRPNVSLAVRAIHSSMNSFTDLDFIIPENIVSPHGISKTFIYTDNINEGINMQTYLTSKLPLDMQTKNIIRPYNAAFDSEYRRAAMEMFRNGETRILICTDAAGMVSHHQLGTCSNPYNQVPWVVTFQTLMLSSNGSSPHPCRCLFSVREEQRETCDVPVSLFFLWSRVPSASIFRQLWSSTRMRQSARRKARKV